MESRPPHHAGDAAHASPAGQSSPSWQSAMLDFLHTRIELIRLESRDATAYYSQKALAAVIALVSGALAWTCILIGLIGTIAHFTKIPWWACTLILGTVHALIAFIAAKKIRPSTRPLFPVTRGEFDKDKLWLQTLKTPNNK